MAKKFTLDRIRNIGIMAHIDAGKTTTTERILYYTGKIHRIGEVHDGAATMDYMEQEKERGITITSAATSAVWGDFQINIIDTPGHVDFTVEVQRSLRVLDGAIAIFCGVGGVEPQSETVWRQADNYRVPRIAFINKMDRTGADFFRALDMMKERFNATFLPIHIPVGSGALFNGLIDLVKMVSVMYIGEGHDMQFEEVEIPSDLLEISEKYREELIETVSEYDDELLELFLEGKEISETLLKKAIRKTTMTSRVVPVICGSAYKNKGTRRLLDAVVDYLPSPLDLPDVTGINPFTDNEEKRPPTDDSPFSALAFKVMSDPHVGRLVFFRVYSGTIEAGKAVYNGTTRTRERIGRILRMHADKRENVDVAHAGDIACAVGLKRTTTGDTICDQKHPIILEGMTFPEPVIQVAIEPKTRADQESLEKSLRKLSSEDPTFQIHQNTDTGQTIISGMGELHLEILIDRLLREFKVEANIGKPQVAYKEAITKPVTMEGRFVRQSGGRGQYGHVKLKVEPLEKGTGLEFENRIVGGAIPKEYIPAVKKGVKEAMNTGVLGGFPVEGVKVTLLDGSYHEVDSSELAFKVAASIAFKDGMRKAGPILLEPMMDVEVILPEQYVGDVMNDLNTRRADIGGIEHRPDAQVIKAVVPLSEMFGYATRLRSLSQGRAIYTMQFSNYRRVSDEKARQLTMPQQGYSKPVLENAKAFL